MRRCHKHLLTLLIILTDSLNNIHHTSQTKPTEENNNIGCNETTHEEDNKENGYNTITIEEQVVPSNIIVIVIVSVYPIVVSMPIRVTPIVI